MGWCARTNLLVDFPPLAAVVRDFLSTTQTQLTVSGLFALNDSLQERDLVALFRSNHLSVLYKRPVDPSDPNGALLYSLVTDESLLREPEVSLSPPALMSSSD
jgi:hypothetical protein